MPLEADDCLLVIRGAVSHVNMPSFCECRFLNSIGQRSLVTDVRGRARLSATFS